MIDEFILALSNVVIVFNIILFFKIWGMTNDVKKIKQHLNQENNDNDFMLLYLCGKYDELYDNLNKGLYNELDNNVLKFSDKEFIEYRNKLLEESKPYYDKIGKEIPEGFKTITRADLV